jgi:hypothetical protein
MKYTTLSQKKSIHNIPDNDEVTSQNSNYHIFLNPPKDCQLLSSIDISESLEKYFKDLSQFEMTCSQKVTQLNFLEAGLILNGSVWMYAKKTELLHDFAKNVLLEIYKYENKENQNITSESGMTRRKNIRDTSDANESKNYLNAFLSPCDITKKRNFDSLRSSNLNDIVLSPTYVPSLSVKFFTIGHSDFEEFCISKISNCAIHTSSGALVIDTTDIHNLDSQLQSLNQTELEIETTKKSAKNLLLNQTKTFNALQVDSSIQSCTFIETEPDEKELASKTSNAIEFLENNKYNSSWQMLDPFEPGGLNLRPFKKPKIKTKSSKKIYA